MLTISWEPRICPSDLRLAPLAENAPVATLERPVEPRAERAPRRPRIAPR